MAIAGRSYANVPVIVRGSLEDPADFGSKTRVLVIAAQPARAQAVVPPAVILRGTLQDPPVLTTAGPVVVAGAPDRRWFAVPPVTVIAAPQAPALTPVATPGPVVVASQPPWPRTVQALTIRGTLQDAPVLATAAPVTVATQNDRRWHATRPALVLAAPQQAAAPPPPASRLLMAGIV